MNNNSKQFLSNRIIRSLRPLNIYNKLKSIYFLIIPKGGRLYKITHGFLSIFLKRFHLFNISYQEWIRKVDNRSEQDLKAILHEIVIMAEKPKISILMPVYNPPLNLLKEAIQSTINQIYPYWELCIADDSSTHPGVIILIEEYMQKDKRIKAVFRTENGHISAASNSALSLVDYPYVALLDHDDVLHPHALYYVAKTILAHPDCEIIYSDEDKLTKGGRRLDPYFKPDFNYDLLLGHNMVSHLGVYRTDTIRKIGGFRVGFEGSQDYDLLLRTLERVKPHQIHHIPFPLYHWRISRQSAAEDINVKPYAIDSGKRSIQEHLERVSMKADVEFSPELAAYKILHPLPSPTPTVTILLKFQNFSQSLYDSINAIFQATNYPNYIITLCLPQSEKRKTEEVVNDWNGKLRFLYFKEELPRSFANIFNQAVRNLTEDYIVFMDQSLHLFSENWLTILLGQASQEIVGAVAPKILYRNKVVYSCGVVILPTGDARHMFKGEEQAVNGYFGWAKLTRGYSALSEKCLVIKRELFNITGGLSTNYITPFYCAIDFCLRLRAIGLRNIVISSNELYMNKNHHYDLKSEFPREALEADRIILKENWGEWIRNDPAFNPNLKIIDEGKLTVELSPNYSFPGQYR